MNTSSETDMGKKTTCSSWLDMVAIAFVFIFILIAPTATIVARKTELETFIREVVKTKGLSYQEKILD